MNAASLEVGPQLGAVLTIIATAVAAWIGTRGVRKEMSTNGGKTMRDAIDRIEQRQIRTDARLDAAGIPTVADEPPPAKPINPGPTLSPPPPPLP